MTEVISDKYVLSDSMRKTRPGTDIFYRTDANAGLNDLKRFEQERNRRLHRYPPNRGPADAKSFDNSSDLAFKKFEDEGTQRCAAPYRDYDNIVDPISGFISAGAAYDRSLPRRAMTAYAKNDGPQYNRPQDIHSIRKGMPGAFPEIDRAHENEPPGVYVHQKLILPGQSRAVLGGWTSKTDQTPESAKLTLLSHLPKARSDMSEQDRLAYKYIYTSTTQSAYEAVPFERSATGGFKQYPPTHTIERHADPVSLTNGRKQTVPPADGWCSKSRGLTWDFRQLRPNYFDRQRPFTYCSPNRRAQQLPTYSGCAGAENIDEIDNPNEPFRPFTVLRTQQPKLAFTAASSSTGQLPGYTGHSRTLPARSAPPSRQVLSETSSSHPPLPMAAEAAAAAAAAGAGARSSSSGSSGGSRQHGRDGEMARMVTTVPPHNPFVKAGV